DRSRILPSILRRNESLVRSDPNGSPPPGPPGLVESLRVTGKRIAQQYSNLHDRFRLIGVAGNQRKKAEESNEASWSREIYSTRPTGRPDHSRRIKAGGACWLQTCAQLSLWCCGETDESSHGCSK